MHLAAIEGNWQLVVGLSSLARAAACTVIALLAGSALAGAGKATVLDARTIRFELTDLVITVDTSIGHLAATMGKPVWILLSFNGDWRWMLDRDDSPWYPTFRLLRQEAPGDWHGIFLVGSSTAMGIGEFDYCIFRYGGINVGEAAAARENCARLRDELWFKGREWFQDRACSMPQDDALTAVVVGGKQHFCAGGDIGTGRAAAAGKAGQYD